MKAGIVAAAIASLAGLWIWPASDDLPQLAVSFAFNPDQPTEALTFALPVGGTVCLIEDLNHRNGQVPAKAEPYADIEGTNRVVLIDNNGRKSMVIDVSSSVPSRPEEWVLANSHCESRTEGEEVLLRTSYDTAFARWTLSLN